jgi:hypothetical protein
MDDKKIWDAFKKLFNKNVLGNFITKMKNTMNKLQNNKIDIFSSKINFQKGGALSDEIKQNISEALNFVTSNITNITSNITTSQPIFVENENVENENVEIVITIIICLIIICCCGFFFGIINFNINGNIGNGLNRRLMVRTTPDFVPNVRTTPDFDVRTTPDFVPNVRTTPDFDVRTIPVSLVPVDDDVQEEIENEIETNYYIGANVRNTLNNLCSRLEEIYLYYFEGLERREGDYNGIYYRRTDGQEIRRTDDTPPFGGSKRKSKKGKKSKRKSKKGKKSKRKKH